MEQFTVYHRERLGPKADNHLMLDLMKMIAVEAYILFIVTYKNKGNNNKNIIVFVISLLVQIARHCTHVKQNFASSVHRKNHLNF